MMYKSTDQRGIAHVIEIVVIGVILLGIGGFIAWRVVSSQQSSNTASVDSLVEKAIANATCDYSDKDLCKFMASWKAGVNYKAELTAIGGGETSKITVESTDQGKKTRTVMAINGAPFENITIDGTTYIKDSNDGKWWKQTSKQATQEPNYIAKQAQPEFSSPDTPTDTGAKVAYNKIGTEACGNKTCFKYQVVNPDVVDTTEYLWFDTKDYQLRCMHTETNGYVTDMSYTYEDISIKEPSPTKDLPAGSYIVPGQSEPIAIPGQ